VLRQFDSESDERILVKQILDGLTELRSDVRERLPFQAFVAESSTELQSNFVYKRVREMLGSHAQRIRSYGLHSDGQGRSYTIDLGDQQIVFKVGAHDSPDQLITLCREAVDRALEGISSGRERTTGVRPKMRAVKNPA
jgi:hypothetical protein